MKSGRIMAVARPMGIVAAAAILTIPAAVLAQGAPPLSATEKIYAELAALPTPERSRRIEQGARQEGKLRLIHTLRSLGAGHVELFHRRYPFLTLDVAGEVG